MPSTSAPDYYLDTNALRSLKFKEELLILITACGEGKINLYVSEVALTELARQRYQSYMEESLHPTSGLIPNPQEYFKRIYGQLKLWFIRHGVKIVDWKPSHDEMAAEIKRDFPVDLNPANSSDERDALILATAFDTFGTSQITFICAEQKLRKIAEAKGYQTIANAKTLVKNYEETGRTYVFDWPTVEEAAQNDESLRQDEKTLERLRSIYPALNIIYAATPSEAGERLLTEKLADIGASDREIRIDILAYTQALAPIGKDHLFDLLSGKATKEIIRTNAERLQQEGIIEDTGTHWIPNVRDESARQICQQAMTQRLDDVIRLIEGS